MDGMTAIFMLYDWTTNAIFAMPVKDCKDVATIQVFKDLIKYLSKRGFKPIFNIMDNVASKAIKTYLRDEDIGIQLVEPNNHRKNTAEQAVQTFKIT